MITKIEEEIIEDFIKDCKRDLNLYKSTKYRFESYINANAYLNLPSESQIATKEHLKMVQEIINKLNLLIFSTEKSIKLANEIIFEES